MSLKTNDGGITNERNEASSFIKGQSNEEKETRTKDAQSINQSIEHAASVPRKNSASANCVCDVSKTENETIDPNAKINNKKCIKGIRSVTPPFFLWIRNYDWRKDLPADCLAGITICVLLIPQVRIAWLRLLSGKTTKTAKTTALWIKHKVHIRPWKIISKHHIALGDEIYENRHIMKSETGKL